MVPTRQKFVLAVCVVLCLPFCLIAQSSEVTSIKIASSWGGLGTGKNNELTITRSADGYHADGKTVDARLIASLLDALNARTVLNINLSNLGITQAWLDANAEKGVREYSNEYYSAAAPNLQALYLSTFKDIGFMKRFVPSLYQTRWTDDYPFVEIEVTKRDGSKIVATSEEQQLFMLPWQVAERGRKIKTYNAHIARALAALLPSDFANKARLSGESLSYELAQKLMWDIKDKWDFLDAENKAGKHLQALKQTFAVEAAEVNSYHNVDFGEEWINGKAGAQNLQATLNRKDLPRNLRIGIALPFKNGEVEGVDAFLGSVDRYLNRALSVPWLNRFMHTRSGTWVELRFVGRRSFSEKAMQIFAADMRLRGKESLVKEVEAVQKDVTLLAVGWKYNRDYWLVLPDKRVVLWRSYADPIKWEWLKSSGWDCSNYGDHCIGAIISTSGRVIGQSNTGSGIKQ